MPSPSHVDVKRAKRQRKEGKERKVNGQRKEKRTDFPFNFYIVDFGKNARLGQEFNFTLISLNFQAFSRPCKTGKEQRQEGNEGKTNRQRKEKGLTFLSIFISTTLGIVSGEKKTPAQGGSSFFQHRFHKSRHTYISHNYDNYSMFRDVPECSRMFHDPGFINGRSAIKHDSPRFTFASCRHALFCKI